MSPDEPALSLSSHINVWNTCLHILRARGYTLAVIGDPEPDGSYPVTKSWVAMKDRFNLTADNPIELLGLAAVSEFTGPTQYRPYWWKLDGPDITAELLEAAFPDPDRPSS